MVSPYIHGVVLSVALLAGHAWAVTPDELRDLTAEGDRDRRAREARIKSDRLDSLVPVTPAPADEGTRPARSTKYGATRSAVTSPGVSSGAAETPAANVYVPPPRIEAGKGIVTDAVQPDTKKVFGIRLGSWLRGEIRRNTSSAEPGLVEIHVTEHAVGDRKTLPSGTILFARKQMNAATKRLELNAQKGITPAGLEFVMSGLVFDLQKVSGLPGIISGDTDGLMKRSAGKGLVAAGQAITQQLAANSPVGEAGSAAAESLLRDGGDVMDRATAPTVTIYVAPQPVLIRVESTF